MKSRQTIGRVLVAIVLAGVAVNLLPIGARGEQSTVPPPNATAPANVRAIGVRFSEAGLRKTATHAPFPDYPPASLAKKTGGVAVVSLRVGFDGRVEQLDVVEAPDSAIGAAVRNAVQRWTFRPATVGTAPEPWKVRGKLTFYFVPEGKGRVVSPEEAASARSAQGPQATQITEAELVKRAKDSATVILDVRPRAEFKQGARRSAVNVPSDEIEARAIRELGTRRIVIDCTVLSERSCRAVAEHLRELGFLDIAMAVRR